MDNMDTGACLVVRSTFRLHDNSALRAALQDPTLRAVVLPIETERVASSPSEIVPTIQRGADGTIDEMHVPVEWMPERPRAWGYHQG